MRRAPTSLLLITLFLAPVALGQVVTTIAGGGPNNMPAVDANLSSPLSVATDSAGNAYVGVSGRIFKVDSMGQLTVLAGNGLCGNSGDNGPAVDAMLCSPIAIAVDTAGNVFFSDSSFQRVRRVEAATGIITTVVGTGATGFSGDGGPAKSATINSPWGLAFDSLGNLYLSDRSNQRIRKVQASGGLAVGNSIISTVAGTGTAGFGGDGGPASAALLNFPFEIAFDPSDNLYIVDSGHRIRRIDAVSGNISTIAGNGTLGYGGEGATATTTPLGSPVGVEADGTGQVFIAEGAIQRVRRIDLALNKIFTVAGNGSTCSSTSLCGDGGAATAAQLSNPRSLAFDSLGRLLIADTGSNRVRRVDLGMNTIVAFAGNRTPGFAGEGTSATGATLSNPNAAVFDSAGNLFFSDGSNRRVRRIDAVTGIITTVAGDGNSCSPTTAACGDGGLATMANVANPIALAFDSAGNLFISDTGTRRVRRVDADTMTGLITPSSTISTVAGNGNPCSPATDGCGDGGPATSATLFVPLGLAFDSLGNLFIADQGAQKVRKVGVDLNGMVSNLSAISTIAGTGVACASSTDPCGDGGAATSATFRSPWGLAIDAQNNLFISDQNTHRIRKVAAGAFGEITGSEDPGEIITTVAGTGALNNGSCFSSTSDGLAITRTFCIPRGIAFDAGGNLWVAEAGGQVLRRINAVGGLITGSSTVTRVMGTGSSGFNGDGSLPLNAAVASPSSVAVNMAGNFFVADSSNNRIRTVDNGVKPAPTLTSLNQNNLPFNWTTTNFNLPVFGTNFVPGSVVRWNGMDRVTTYINQSRIDATIPPSDFAVQGVFPVTVFTSGPGGGTSNALNFTVSKRTVSPSFGCGTMTPGAASTCTVSTTDSGSGTRGLPTGTVNFTTSSAGTLSASSCTLNPNGSISANCQVTYTPDVGTEGQTHSITAMYSGDGNYFSATTNTSQLVRRATSAGVVCTPNSVPVNSPTTCTATFTDLSPGTVAPPDGTVTWTNFSQGTYDPTSCVLAPISGTASSCSTTFTPFPNFAQSGLSICTSTVFSGPPRLITSGSTCGSITAASRSTSTTMSCAPNPIPMGGTTTCTITVTDTAPGTPLTPPGVASYFTNRFGTFSPVSPCASSGSDSSFSCTFDYTAGTNFNNNGTHNITGSYNSSQQNPIFNNARTHLGSSQSFALSVQDPTPPVVTPNISGTLGDNGWYRSNVTVSWTRTDPETTISSIVGCSTSTVTTDTTGVTFSCSATSGGGTTTESVTIKRDTTNPTLSFGAANPAANANGWQNADVSFPFTASDATSGVASTSVPSPLLLTAEGTAVNGTVTVTDNAGNSATFTSPTVKIDKTPPSASASRSPAANANGWNNVNVTVSYACSDALSGLAAGSPPAATVVSTEGANQSASGTCTDKAGNTATATINDINIDKTPPTVTGNRSPAANAFGWNNTDVTVSFLCSDALSGPAAGSTSADVIRTAEGANQSAAGSCMDNAGNNGSTTVTGINIDKTPPTAGASASPAPNATGWNNTDVTVSFSGTDALAGIDSCSSPSVLAAEGAGQSASGTCSDKAGNTSTLATASGINIDKTPPTVTGSRSPAANAFGWNNSDVTVSFFCSDSLSGLAAGSPPANTVLSAEGAGQSALGSCSDHAGNSASATVSGINIDKTPPTATGTPSRAADSNGWYNGAFSVSWSGADALAGIDSCGANNNYSGPDTSTGSFSGTCMDKAGNPGTGSFSFKYDATPPVITIVTPPNLATYTPGQTVAASYSCSDPMSSMGTCAGTVANGANVNTATTGSFNFTVTATDQAGNAASKTNSYSVGPQYTFIGFLQPIDNLPVINQAKPGKTIPIKWQIKDAAGNFVSDLSTLTSLLSAPIACDASPTAIVEEQLASPGSTVFRYDATANQFIYNWQSASNWKGCRLLQLTLSDGSQQWAKFNFK